MINSSPYQVMKMLPVSFVLGTEEITTAGRITTARRNADLLLLPTAGLLDPEQ